MKKLINMWGVTTTTTNTTIGPCHCQNVEIDINRSVPIIIGYIFVNYLKAKVSNNSLSPNTLSAYGYA